MSDTEKPETGNVFPSLDQTGSDARDAAGLPEQSIDAMMTVPLQAEVIVGYAELTISQLLRLTRGSIIDLNRKVGDMVDVVFNGQLVARGELLRLENDYLGVKLVENVKKHPTEL
jgi:flagellar motor switch protein FliN